MPKRKKRLDPDDPLKELEKLLSKLDDDQGMVARRNARTAVCAELRRVRTFIDKEYPSLTPKKQRRKRKTGQAKIDELFKKGWVTVSPSLVGKLASAGIKPKKTRENGHTKFWVPDWAVEILDHPKCSTSMLQKAKRSATYRKEILMESRLLRGEMTSPKLRLMSATPGIQQVADA